MEIRLLTSAAIAAANDIVMRAYQSPSRLTELERYLRLQPDGWFLAWESGQAVGLAGTIDYGDFAYLGLVSVLPEAQRGGIGRALMRQILAWLAARDCPLVLLDASPVGQPLYQKLGFITTDASVVWGRAAATHPPSAVRPPMGGIHLMEPTDIAEVVAYDRPRFGADRTAALADLLMSHPRRAAFTRDAAGCITGFAIAQPRILGPWLADDVSSAAALLAWAWALDEPPTGMLVPAHNAQAAALLTSAGFAVQRKLAHMRLGTGATRDRTTHYGLASFTLG
ncbi:MAG: GNAT family N-acetyltransferase [Ktedonobacterales bacterium]|nr:GNAT family N-acetyltransferase [Ktedonobacterales bacterium]